MPVYEYECSECGHRIEILQKISDPPVECCEVCNGHMKKLISRSTFHLKGTGWYATDYASKETSSSKSHTQSSSTESGKNASLRTEKITSGSSSRPKPFSPLASSPSVGSIR